MGLRCGWNHFALWLSRICRSDFLGGKRRNECWMVVSWSSAQGFLNARPSVPTGYKGAGPLPLQRRFDSGYIHTIRGGGAFLRQLKKGRWGTVDRGETGEEPGAIWASRRLPMTDAQEEVPFSFPAARFNELNIGQPIADDDCRCALHPTSSHIGEQFPLLSLDDYTLNGRRVGVRRFPISRPSISSDPLSYSLSPFGRLSIVLFPQMDETIINTRRLAYFLVGINRPFRSQRMRRSIYSY